MWHCDFTALINPSVSGVDAIIQLTYSSFHKPSGLLINISLKINPKTIIADIEPIFFTIVKIPL